MVLTIWLCVPIARGLLARCRADDDWKAKAWPIAWRLAVLAILGTATVEQGGLLQLSPVRMWGSPMDFPPRNTMPIVARLGLLPVVTGLGLIGVVAGLMPVREALQPSSRRGLPPRWFMVPLVVVAGLLMVVLLMGTPTLVLIAIDGVTSALRSSSGRPLPDVLMRGTASLAARVDRAAAESLAALGLCMFAGIVVARDLRRDLSSETISWWAFAPRIAMTLAVSAAGARLILVTATTLHPSLYDGMVLVMERFDLIAIASGFSLFAAGLAARAASPRIAPTVEVRRPQFVGGRVVIGAVVLTLAALLALNQASTATDPDSLSTPDLYGLLGGINEWITDRFPGLNGLAMSAQVAIAVLVLSLVLSGLAWSVALANRRRPEDGASPMDSIVASRARLAWFLWCWWGLTTLCLVALPAFTIGGLTIEHLRIRPGGFLGLGVR